MRWETIEPDLRKRLWLAPGSTSLANELVSALHLAPGQKALDISPGTGVLASMAAREHRVDVTCIANEPKTEAAIETVAAALGVSDRVTVAHGTPSDTKLNPDEFDRIYSLGQPWIPLADHGVISEIYRVLKPDGFVGLAGPAAIINSTPDYMESVVKNVDGARLKTPAYTALMFAQEGFHIVNAEFYPHSYDHWIAWLREAPAELVTDDFRRAVIQDSGRWLALGLIVLRKPPRPSWAV
ncbi:MAG TPA: class I SAM-dependent methyltransferase [Firmicutes bacterium]|nr:class I SAM-dependent methyltransferase [Bacillota bacterium]